MTRPKQLIVATIAAVACTGAAAHLLAHHRHAMTESPARLASYTAEACPGNDTPESALQSLGWAASKGDFKLLRAGVTPEIQKMLDGGGPNMPAHALNVATELAAGMILSKEVIADGQVIFYVQTEGKDHPQKVRMDKVAGGWKLAAIEH
jgi:hypothetical protein